jgi:hypothetical protein
MYSARTQDLALLVNTTSRLGVPLAAPLAAALQARALDTLERFTPQQLSLIMDGLARQGQLGGQLARAVVEGIAAEEAVAMSPGGWVDGWVCAGPGTAPYAACDLPAHAAVVQAVIDVSLLTATASSPAAHLKRLSHHRHPNDHRPHPYNMRHTHHALHQGTYTLHNPLPSSPQPPNPSSPPSPPPFQVMPRASCPPGPPALTWTWTTPPPSAQPPWWATAC